MLIRLWYTVLAADTGKNKVDRFRDWGRDVGMKTSPWLLQTVAFGLGLLALALSTGSLGNLSRMLNGVLAVTALLALAMIIPWRPWKSASRRWVAALAIMAISQPVVARGEPLGLLAAALFFFALSLVTSHSCASIPSALLLTTVLYGLYRLAVTYGPGAWHFEQSLAIGFSSLAGAGLRLGPTALGLPLFVLFAAYAVSVFLLSLRRDYPPGTLDTERDSKLGWRSVGDLFAWLLALALAVVAHIWLQPRLAGWLLSYWPAPVTPSRVPVPPPNLTFLESLPLLFLLLWLASALASMSMRPLPLRLSPRPGSARWVIVGLVLLSLATALFSLDPPSRPNRGTILFHDTGHLEWGRPVFGQYGPRSGGTFGLWPDYLEAYGYQTRIGALSAQNLEAAQAVVLINMPEKLGAKEKERLLAFVREGGGLIIWGEHTGVGRIREPINDLLADLPGAPIHLRFDSAVPVRQGWAEGLTLRAHPAVYDVQDPVDLVIAVGASLRIRPPARPIIVGRFGHSDQGDVTNQARNYVGDMRYNPGEQLGDVVLAAETKLGRGRIVVLGDTTPLGSVNLMTTMPFQARLLDWVTAEQPEVWGIILRNGWLAALLLTGAGVCLGVGRSRLALAGVALVLGLTLTVTGIVNLERSLPAVPAGPIAYVDASHQARFDRLLWEETSIGGLDYNLVRSGMLPLLLHEIDSAVLAEADLLVLVAPGERFTEEEVEGLNRWVEAGGRLLVSVGYEESEASEALLASFGLAVGHIPLGPVELERDTGHVRFHEAWPVVATGSEAVTIVEGYGYPLAVHRHWGKGGITLIADSAFLLSENLEGQHSYQEGNILLLRDILQQYLDLGGEP
jgi:hypothetical protein